MVSSVFSFSLLWPSLLNSAASLVNFWNADKSTILSILAEVPTTVTKCVVELLVLVRPRLVKEIPVLPMTGNLNGALVPELWFLLRASSSLPKHRWEMRVCVSLTKRPVPITGCLALYLRKVWNRMFLHFLVASLCLYAVVKLTKSTKVTYLGMSHLLNLVIH